MGNNRVMTTSLVFKETGGDSLGGHAKRRGVGIPGFKTIECAGKKKKKKKKRGGLKKAKGHQRSTLLAGDTTV